jgi:hypothetical protein
MDNGINYNILFSCLESFVRESMSSCDVSNSVEVGSNDIYVDGGENNQRIQMQVIFITLHFNFFIAI